MELETKVNHLVNLYGFTREEANQELVKNKEDILVVLRNSHNIKKDSVKQTSNQAQYSAYRNIFYSTKDVNETKDVNAKSEGTNSQ